MLSPRRQLCSRSIIDVILTLLGEKKALKCFFSGSKIMGINIFWVHFLKFERVVKPTIALNRDPSCMIPCFK